MAECALERLRASEVPPSDEGQEDSCRPLGLCLQWRYKKLDSILVDEGSCNRVDILCSPAGGKGEQVKKQQFYLDPSHT